jgi:cytochrome c553
MTNRLLRSALARLLASGIAFALPAATFGADYIDQRSIAAVHGDAGAGAAKAAVCAACHGPNGNAIVPAFPRLAGQHAEYLYGELLKFKRGTRPQSPMTAQAATLSDQDMRNLASFFAAQAPIAQAPAPAPDPALIARGETVYKQGNAASGVPPCLGCHGADAKGPAVRERHYAAWPALRGQHADYVVQRLKDYRDGARTDSSNDFIMHGVARTLDDASIAAVAAYLGSLSPADPP